MLPPFLVNGYSAGGGEDGVIRSHVGRAQKSRPRWTGAPSKPINARIKVNRAQLQTFWDFYHITLGRVLAFNHYDPTKPDPTPVEYRFTAMPTEAPGSTARYWYVTMELEQLTSYQGTFPLSDEHGNNLLSSPGGDELTT